MCLENNLPESGLILREIPKNCLFLEKKFVGGAGFEPAAPMKTNKRLSTVKEV